MEIFLEFLKYGAIGIAMVLAVLSYRLLSKEQEKEHVREPMLKSIRNYFLLSIVLSLFFGATEIATLFIAPSTPTDNKSKEEVTEIYTDYISETHKAKTYSEKLKWVKYYVRKGIDSTYDTNSLELKKRISELEKELESAHHTVYMEAVWSLSEMVSSDPEKFINIDHNIGNKDIHYNLMERVLEHVHAIKTEIQDRKTRIRESWKAYKKTYAILGEMNKLEYIVSSDIKHFTQLIH